MPLQAPLRAAILRGRSRFTHRGGAMCVGAALLGGTIMAVGMNRWTLGDDSGLLPLSLPSAAAADRPIVVQITGGDDGDVSGGGGGDVKRPRRAKKALFGQREPTDRPRGPVDTSEGLGALLLNARDDAAAAAIVREILRPLSEEASSSKKGAAAGSTKTGTVTGVIDDFGASGLTPLMVAAFLGDVETARELLDAGADADKRSQGPQTPRGAEWLWRLTTSRHRDPQQRLMEPGYAALEFALRGGHPDTAALLAEAVRSDPTGSSGSAVRDAATHSLIGNWLRTTRGGSGNASRALTVDQVLALDREQTAGGGLGGLFSGVSGGAVGSGSSAATSGDGKCLSPQLNAALTAAVDAGTVRLDDDAAAAVERVLTDATERGWAARQERRRQHRAKFPLEARLGERIVGQRHALQVVASAVRRKENGWVDLDAPLVMLFMGSSGIGKTQTAKLVAEYLFDGKERPPPLPSPAQQQLSPMSPGFFPPGIPGFPPTAAPPAAASPAEAGASNREDPCFIRVDMSEFQSKHEVSKFIGAPPGYIGFDVGGQLVNKLQRCPNAVVLLDEVEKAHPDVLTVMLQTFDEGRLTDGKGTTIDCREAVFILTSNLAQQEIADEAVRLREDAQRRETQHLHTAAATSQLTSAAPPQNGVRATGAGGEEAQSELLTKAFKRDVVQPILRSHFGRDEFLGRINEIVFFLPFTAPERHALAEAELRLWADRAAARHRMSLNWTPRVCERIGDDDYDLRYGARSIKYAVDRRCIGPIAKQHEVGGVGPGCYMRLRGVEEPPLDRCPVSSSASDRQGRSTDAAPAQEPTSYPAGHGLVLDVCVARSGGDYLTGEAQVSTKKGGLLRKLFG